MSKLSSKTTIHICLFAWSLSAPACAPKFAHAEDAVLRAAAWKEGVDYTQDVADKGIVCISYPRAPYADTELYRVTNGWGSEDLGMINQGSHFCFYAEVGELTLKYSQIKKTDSSTEPYITTDISIIAGERTYIVFTQLQLPGGDFLFAVCVSPELGVQSLEETQYMVPAAKKKKQDLYGFIEPHASAEANLNRRSENEGRGQTCRSSKQHEVFLKTFVHKY